MTLQPYPGTMITMKKFRGVNVNAIGIWATYFDEIDPIVAGNGFYIGMSDVCTVISCDEQLVGVLLSRTMEVGFVHISHFIDGNLEELIS